MADDFDFDPAHALLPAGDYSRVRDVAEAVVELYGGGGPPFPILKLWELLGSLAKIERLEDGWQRHLYGYSFALDFARHRKYAALYIDSTAPPDEMFITAFHETGHILLHILRPNDPPKQLFDRQAAVPHLVSREQAEIEANLFARLTTMPAAWVRTAWAYASTLVLTPQEAAVYMAVLFSVPPAWMRARLVALGLLPAPRG